MLSLQGPIRGDNPNASQADDNQTAYELDPVVLSAAQDAQEDDLRAHGAETNDRSPALDEISEPFLDSVRNERRSRAMPGSEHRLSEAFINSLPYHTPIQKPEGYPELKYKPLLLRRRLLIPLFVFYVCCLAFVAALVALNTFAPTDLHIRRSVGYNAFNYVPSVLGSVTTTTFRSLVSSYGRLLPYLTMSASTFRTRQRNDVHNTNTILVGSFVSLHLIPNDLGFELLRYGHYLTFALFWSRVIINGYFASFKAALIRVTPDSHGWQVSISNPVGYALIAMYTGIIASTLAIIIRTWDATTGLKWDPGSYAAQIALLQNSNVPAVLRALDLDASASNKIFMEKLRAIPASLGPLRLGYWRATEDETKILHGIGFIGSPKKPVRTRQSPDPDPGSLEAVNVNVEYERSTRHGSVNLPTDFKWDEYKTPTPEQVRYFCPSFWQSDCALLVGFTMCCTITGVFVWWITSGKLKSGWIFKHPAASNAGPPPIWLGEVYIAAIPALTNSLLSMLWFNADLFYRASAPLAGMFVPRDARETILLDYLSPDVVTTVVTGLGNWHWRVVWFTLLTLIAPYISVFAANIFLIRRGDTVDHLTIIPTNLYVSLAAVSLYAISCILARPPIEYRFPRMVLSISDLLSYCYDSSLMTAKEFSAQEPDDEEIHLRSKIHLAKRKYYFGFYRGTDGKRHLGFDANEFSESGGKAASVHAVIPGKYPCFLFRKPWWIGSRRHKNCRPRLARLENAREGEAEAGQDENGSGLARTTSAALSFATAHEFADGESDDDGQIRPIGHVDTLIVEDGLGHGRRASQPAAGSSGVRRFRQSHSLQQRAAGTG
ncbi:uncharacterized protein Z520_03166 [Fonsecaea multimorphosa CBS 102226]|uniref:Uncharacterized protein n=1 Tax=Fonsecaea multimorphosa CBS 102226 TaxID=1442371 RepID=A0A0D2KXQ8_9EURO|nr:uncharacterized protein Z520_03166 [Fonsecaea multimorphosa CBS 102226]KIY01614.1 hypothetical protein Z520_03166 [Fonsecaea multimorphosa CBS 102226]OAL28125.1 hypothetical protein AYO22_03152 [Fonsecaea multimorphosa]